VFFIFVPQAGLDEKRMSEDILLEKVGARLKKLRSFLNGLLAEGKGVEWSDKGTKSQG